MSRRTVTRMKSTAARRGGGRVDVSVMAMARHPTRLEHRTVDEIYGNRLRRMGRLGKSTTACAVEQPLLGLSDAGKDLHRNSTVDRYGFGKLHQGVLRVQVDVGHCPQGT